MTWPHPKLCECGCGKPAPISKETSNWHGRGYIKGQPVRFIQGHATRINNPGLKTQTHGMRLSPEYASYSSARGRCLNQNDTEHWKNYGGRGIKFLFTSFEDFILHLGFRPSPRHSLDRINNDGHYEPGNVRWATKREQRENQRKRLRLEQFSTEELLTEIRRRERS